MKNQCRLQRLRLWCHAWWLLPAFATMSVAASDPDRPPKSCEWLVKTWEVENGLPENSATATTGQDWMNDGRQMESFGLDLHL